MEIKLLIEVTIFILTGHLWFCMSQRRAIGDYKLQRIMIDSKELPGVVKTLTDMNDFRPDLIIAAPEVSRYPWDHRRSRAGWAISRQATDNRNENHASQDPNDASSSQDGNNKHSSKNSTKPWYRMELHYQEAGNSDNRDWKFHPKELILQSSGKNGNGASGSDSVTGRKQRMWSIQRDYSDYPSQLKRGYMYSDANGNYHRMDQQNLT